MDRLDALEAFVFAVDQGSLSAAARALGRSLTAVSRALTELEQRLGVTLLRRTTRSLSLTDAGERYLVVARRVLAELAEADHAARDAQSAPTGLLTVTAPVLFGAMHVRPVVDRYLSAHAGMRARLLLLDRVVHLIDEGIDVAVRIGHLPDSALVATPLGFVRRVLCASPGYLDQHGSPREPRALAEHRCIQFSGLVASDHWTFAPGPDEARGHSVRIQPVLQVNHAEAAIASAIAGQGVTMALSYQVAAPIEAGALVPLLTEYAPEPVPVHLVHPGRSTQAAKLRAFVALAVPSLREALAAPIATAPPARVGDDPYQDLGGSG